MTDKEKIRAEIDKRLKGLSDSCVGQRYAYQTLLSFIDSMQEDSVSEELEDEIDAWCRKVITGLPIVKEAARHFAGWQKEQMIKDAVDGEVTYGKSLSIPSLGYVLDKNGLDFGDKVKLIIIKQEEE